MANAAMRVLRAAQCSGNGDSGRKEESTEGKRQRKRNKSKSPKKKKKVVREEEEEEDGEQGRQEPDRVEDDEDHGEPVLYEDDFDLDQPTVMEVLANEEVTGVHSRINFNRHLRVVEQQCLQQAAFMKYLRGTVVPHFSEIRDNNEHLEGEVSELKASIELVGKDLKSYKAQNETLKTAKDKTENSNTGLRTELKKAREDLAVRTAEVEAAKKEADNLRAEAKWEEEKAKLVAIGANLVRESFENAMAQIRLRNPELNLDGMSHEFEVLHGHICRVDSEARKLYDVDTGDEVVDCEEEGEYRKED
ncbi:kinesin [Sesbania bispinosa]|nr:kinesin [Sesbania bispinosa]